MKLRVYLRKTKGGGSRVVFPKCKQKKLEVKTYGPLEILSYLNFLVTVKSVLFTPLISSGSHPLPEALTGEINFRLG